MSTMVVKTIVSRANAAGLYSISADETTDKQRKVDLALGIRYVHEMQAEERVISVVDLQQRDGDFIARVVLNQLETHDLPTDRLVSQTHDGASVMSGKRKGVQAIISKNSSEGCSLHPLFRPPAPPRRDVDNEEQRGGCRLL